MPPAPGDDGRSVFDRMAGATAHFTARAPFFAACVLLVLIWGPSYFLLGDVNTWQLVINTATTIVTFLLVALLQNTQRRGEEAIQHKLNAIADALADLMEHQIDRDPTDLRADIEDLKAASGIEQRM
jgi:low affinity Fe/Cu permease